MEIVDHKVTTRRATPAELAGDLQLNLYGALARARWPETTDVVGTHHYPTGSEAISVPLSEAGMAAARDHVKATGHLAAADHTYELKPGPACDHCPWQPRCPVSAPT